MLVQRHTHVSRKTRSYHISHPVRIVARAIALSTIAVASLSAQPLFRQATAVLPGGLATLQSERAVFAGDAGSLGAALSTEGFETAVAGHPLNFGGFTVSLLSGSFGVTNDNNLVITEGSRAINFETPTTLRFTFSSAVNAFGLDITSIDFASTSIDFADNLGNSTVLATAPEFASANFFGVTNTQAFSWVDFTFAGDESIVLDNVQFGSAAAAVPEPATLFLLSIGAALLLAVQARRQRIG